MNEQTPKMTVFKQPGGFTWLNITEPSTETNAELKQRYPFLLDIDLRDCLPPFQRPKLMERENYLFIVLLFPVYDRKNKTVGAAELDVFIGKDFIITNHDNRLQPLIDAAVAAGEKNLPPGAKTADGTAGWLHALLNNLLVGVFPMLVHVSQDVSALESSLVRETSGQTVSDLLRVKTNIVEMRRIMQGHKHVIEKFMFLASRILDLKKFEVYYEDLIGHSKEIWDSIENERQTVETVYDSYMSRISYESGEATKTLTAMAFIVFPTTLVATVFMMDSQHNPIYGLPGDWWIMLAITLTTACVIMVFLKRKKWL